jgi:hypothetical protein
MVARRKRTKKTASLTQQYFGDFSFMKPASENIDCFTSNNKMQ